MGILNKLQILGLIYLKLKILYIALTTGSGFMVMYFSIHYKNLKMFLIGMTLSFTAPFFVMYTADLKLKEFTKHTDILKEVLDEQNLLTHDKINLLAKETGNLYYRVSNTNLDWFAKLIPGVLGTATAGAIIANINSGIILLIFSASILILEFAYLIYSFFMFVPNSRLKRRKKFHELLMILLIQVY